MVSLWTALKTTKVLLCIGSRKDHSVDCEHPGSRRHVILWDSGEVCITFKDRIAEIGHMAKNQTEKKDLTSRSLHFSDVQQTINTLVRCIVCHVMIVLWRK